VSDKLSYEFDSFRLVPSERQLLRDGKAVSLPPKAFDTLVLLVENNGHALKKDDLLKQVWPDSFVEESNLSHNISLIRKALNRENNGDGYVETVRGYGFRFKANIRRLDGEPEILLHRQTRTHVVFKQHESETISTVNTTRSTQKTMLGPLTISALILFVVAGALGLYFWFIRPAPRRSASSASTAGPTGSKRWPENAEAYQAYLNGRSFWNKRTPASAVKSAEYFRRAIELDPNFALAYVGLADAYNYFPLDRDQKAPLVRAALEKALALDETLAEAHATLGNLSLFDDWDWPEAERRLRRAIELDPNYPTAHHWYAYYLAAMGRLDEALAEIRRARELDPLSLIINADVGQLLHFARRDDEAIEQLRRTIEMDRGFVMAHHRLAEVYERTGKFDEALAEFQKAYPGYQTELPQMATVARVYALSGNQSEARRILARIARAPKGEGDMVSKPSMALIHAGLGETEQAFAWLETALTEKDAELILLKSNPLFDSLRPDPRFQTILRRMKLS
jgi:DNA-binding winged helix-turn-helix (wHTH) protein/tetratricopeptide (TPR) repeat protein